VLDQSDQLHDAGGARGRDGLALLRRYVHMCDGHIRVIVIMMHARSAAHHTSIYHAYHTHIHNRQATAMGRRSGAGGGYICSSSGSSFDTFSTPPPPIVVTGRPYNIGGHPCIRFVDDLRIVFLNFALILFLNIDTSGHSNGSTLSGSFSSFVPGHDLVAYYLYAPCDSYNTTRMTTANQSFPNTSGNGTLTPVAVTGLPAETSICTQTCVVDLDANATMGDPVGPVCGAVQTFSWLTPVRIDAPISLGRTPSCRTMLTNSFCTLHSFPRCDHDTGTRPGCTVRCDALQCVACWIVFRSDARRQLLVLL